MKIALINAPFITVRHSSPALSLFKTLLKNIDVDSDVLYWNIDFYNQIQNYSVHEFLIKNVYNGDWVASRLAFGELGKDEDYFNKCDLKPKARILMLSLRDFYEKFANQILIDYDLEQYEAFAFSTNIGQTVCAISLAKLLKQKFPDKFIFFGGYGVFNEIGVELLNKVPYIDAAFWHNSDKTFIEAINRFKTTKDLNQIMQNLGSSVYRYDNKLYANYNLNHIDHNEVPIPDFDDYLNKDVNACYFRDKYEQKWCNIEFSRGCYYGESVVCTFCSEPGIKMKTKPKTYENAIRYLDDLENRYKKQYFVVGDSLLPQGYIENVFNPWHQNKKTDTNFFLELKPYVTPKQLQILKESGVTMIQPGIESFHPEILKLTKKGHKVHHGISFLNFCEYFGIETRWNYLVLVPLEKPEWYKEQISMIKKVTHLQKPNTIGRIIITKYTPYSDNPSYYGISELSPDSFYSSIYPDYFDMNKLCWNYDNKYQMHPEVGILLDELNLWMKSPKRKLEFVEDLLIYDNRTTEKTISLTEKQKNIIRFCLYPKSITTIKRVFGDVDEDLNFLELNHLTYNADNRVVSYVKVPLDFGLSEFVEEKQLVQLSV